MGVFQRFEYEGVEGIRVGRFRIGINTSAILYRIGDVLIDTGPANQWGAVRRLLDERPPARLVLTHYHEDHSGNAARIRRRYGCTVFAPESERDWLRHGFPMHLYRRVFWGTAQPVDTEAMPSELRIGREMTLRPIFVQGHARDMACLIEPARGWLFSGDLYIATAPRYLRADECFSEIVRSLGAILAYDFRTLFCAHRGVVTDGKAALAEKLECLQGLRERARDLERAGLSSRAITRRLLGREDGVFWVTGGHFSKRNLIRGCLARDVDA